MRNEEIKKLIENTISKQNSLCLEHGTDIAKIQAVLPNIESGINTLIVRQSDLIDRIARSENEITAIKTEKRIITAVVGAVASIVSLAIGVMADYLFRRN